MDKKITDQLTETFITHPMWPYMVEFIESHFEHSADVKSIDVSNSSSTVHAEVIATQKISADIESLKSSFEKMKRNYGNKRPSYE